MQPLAQQRCGVQLTPRHAPECRVARLCRPLDVRRRIAQQEQQVAPVESSGGGGTQAGSPAAPDQQLPKQAVLRTKFKAHDASVTALAVLKDEAGLSTVVTSSLDKTLAVWTLQGGGGLEGPQLACARLEVPGGPVFSLHRGIRTKVTDANVKPREPVLFCGLAAKEVVALRPDTLAFSEQMHMNGHTGWVRSLASSGKYLFSCGCNNLHEWDQAYAAPKEVRRARVFTGDILALAASSRAVFTAGADGSLRAWLLGKVGELCEGAVRERAHDGRITSLAVSGSLLFSAGYDGHIKAWDVATLKLVMEVKAAHAGERVRALVIGPTPASNSSSSAAASPSSSPPGSSHSSPAPSPLPPSAAATTPPSAAHDTAPAAAAAAAAAAAKASAVASTAEEDALYTPSEPALAQAADAVHGASLPRRAADAAGQQQEAAAAPAAAAEPAPSPAPADSAPAEQAHPLVAAAAAPADAGRAPAGSEEEVECIDVCAPAAAAAAAAANGDGQVTATSPRPPSPSCAAPGAVLYSGGDDGLVRRWDARLLSPAGEPLAVHGAAVKALAVGDKEVLVSGDASGEVAVWLV